MRFLLFGLALFLSTFPVFSQESSYLLRTPAISPDGQNVAFSYQGDIWRMNINGTDLKRLTIHESYEFNPVWSPDGKQIAFTGSRYGNNDVFTIQAEGGTPKRLTYHSANDDVFSWQADQLLFTTTRAFKQEEWDLEIYGISASGGTPERILDAVGGMPAASPNGQYIAFTIGACRIAREQYKGPADNEIWLYDTKQKAFTRLTNNEMNDYLPKWADDNTLYYISAVSGRYNIVKQSLDNGQIGTASTVTNFTDDGVRHFGVAGDQLVFERKSSIYKMKTGGKAVAIPVNISGDYRFDPQERATFSANISNYALSPNEKYIAMEIHGEIFIKENKSDKSRTVNVSNHPYRDRHPAWINDSTLLFVSDREGDYNMYMVTSADKEKPNLFISLKHNIKRITDSKESEMGLVVSPNRKKIAYQVGRGKLKTADIDEKGKLTNVITLVNNKWDTPSGVAWSPDSRWLAYAVKDLNFNSDIYIQAADNSHPAVNVSMHPKGDQNPFWSEDGSKLGFSSNRNNSDYDVWFVWLNQEEYQKTSRDRDEGYYFDEEDATEEKDKKGGKKKDKKTEPIVIDFDQIHDRLAQVTALPGNESSFIISKDGEHFYFTTSIGLGRGSDLYQVKWNGQGIKQLTKGGTSPRSLSYSTKTDEVYYTSKGSLSKIRGDKATRLPHTATMIIDHQQERDQIFEEGWRALNEGFYDPNFHGQNWLALKKKYKPWTMAASTTQDFRYMYNIMLEQLNASHMGMAGPDRDRTQSESTGRLGIEVRPVKNGVEVTHIVPNTPADKLKSLLIKGDVITAVNGTEINENINFHALLANEATNQVLLNVKNSKGTPREVVIRPSRSISTQLYEDWIKERQKLTDKYSGGKLGYIHIRGMDMPSFERFERELMASGLGKEGIVIDVRYNGGGWTTDYLMAVLNVKQHAYTIPRGVVDDLEKEHQKYSGYYPYSERLPLSAWVKPSVALCNESSYSNAEIFSHAYKTLDIGTLVGIPTFGAVVSTGSQGLMDGSSVRMPFRGWYVKATGENMENGPAVPDVLIDNAPDSKAKGEDLQLKKAVEVLLGEMKGK